MISLRRASKAALPGILSLLGGFLTCGGAKALEIQLPSQQINPATAESPAQSAIGAESPTDNAPTPAQSVPLPAPSYAPWYDGLFSHKLPVEFGFHLGEAYSDNIYYQPKKTYDYITTISPSLTFTLGQEIKLDHRLDEETLDILTNSGNLNYLKVTYYPTLTLYERNPSLDVVDEYADVVYSHLFGKLTLSLEQKYEKLSEPTIQTNAQGTLINRDIFTTVAKANYFYSDKLSTYGTLTQTVTHYISGNFTDNTEWVGDYFFLYQLFPKLSLGLGPRIGAVDIDREPNQDYQAGLIHLAFALTGKVTLTGAAGAEVREFEHDASATEVTPIVEGKAIYQPFDSMTVTLDGERHRIVSSGQPGDDYTASAVSLEFRQRFFQVAYFIAEAGYENDEYSGNDGVAGGNARNDNIYFLNAGLEWTSYRGIKVDAGYSYLRDDSNFKNFTFTENCYTVSATVKY